MKGATIGANAIIVCGITLGRYSFVGAGAVVTKDIPDYGLVLGNLAAIWLYEPWDTSSPLMHREGHMPRVQLSIRKGRGSSKMS